MSAISFAVYLMKRVVNQADGYIGTRRVRDNDNGGRVDVYWRSYGSEAVYTDIKGGRKLPSGNSRSKYPLR